MNALTTPVLPSGREADRHFSALGERNCAGIPPSRDNSHQNQPPVARLRHYLKNIACLESIWDSDLENRMNVLPVLELTARATGAKFIYLTCNTRPELRHNLELLRKKKFYGILLLSFHGEPGVIELAGTRVKLESLAWLMGKHFAGWVVHFASCSTVKIDEERMARFVELTGVAMVLGYTKAVDWTEGTVMDLLLLSRLQYYRNVRSLWKHLARKYPDLLEITGLQVFPKM
jgi:hypothetical protein